jgi:TRAP-type C4-dicarboxylate transport system permease small subunit
LIGGLRLVSLTFAQGQVSPALKIPMGYVYLSVPIAGFFLTFYSIEFLVEVLLKIKGLRELPDAT